jgi:hypothetical protein
VKTRQFRSNGREPYVFRVDHPEELFGSHADLMREALGPEERLLYLLYAPIWEGEEAPFGVRAPSASHAVAVTEERFIVSEDRHQTGVCATVFAVPFHRVIEVELGSALLIGWFAVRFIRDGDVVSSSVLFPASTGMLHFATAIRHYRRATQPEPASSSQRGMVWHEVLGATRTLLAGTPSRHSYSKENRRRVRSSLRRPGVAPHADGSRLSVSPRTASCCSPIAASFMPRNSRR